MLSSFARSIIFVLFLSFNLAPTYFALDLRVIT